MIDKLTPEQEALLPVYKDKWIKIGLSTERCDRAKAEEAIRDCYKAQKQTPPKEIVWFESPKAASDFIRDKLKPKTTIREYGSFEAGSLSYYNYFLEVFNLKECKPLEPYMRLAENCNIWWIIEEKNMAVCSEKPTAIRMENNVLHSMSNLALEWSDGFGIAAVRGTKIPNEWIARKFPKVEELLRWPNADQRNVGCELMGWHKILDEIHGEIIDKDKDPMVGELIEAKHPELDGEKFLRAICGTGRTIALPVPRNMKTALEANAWTYNIPTNLLRQNYVRT